MTIMYGKHVIIYLIYSFWSHMENKMKACQFHLIVFTTAFYYFTVCIKQSINVIRKCRHGLPLQIFQRLVKWICCHYANPHEWSSAEGTCILCGLLTDGVLISVCLKTRENACTFTKKYVHYYKKCVYSCKNCVHLYKKFMRYLIQCVYFYI